MALKGCPGKGKSAVGLPCPAGLGACALGGCTGSRHLQLGHLHQCMFHGSRNVEGICHDNTSVGKTEQAQGTGIETSAHGQVSSPADVTVVVR